MGHHQEHGAQACEATSLLQLHRWRYLVADSACMRPRAQPTAAMDASCHPLWLSDCRHYSAWTLMQVCVCGSEGPKEA